MKKIYKIIMILIMVVSFTACSKETNEPIEIKIGKESQFKDLISFKIETISKPKQITPDIIDSKFTYYTPTKDGNVLLDMVMQITNLKDKEISLTDKLTGTFTIGDIDYITSMALVGDDGKSISQTVNLAANKSGKVHLYAEVDPKELDKEIEFKFATNDQENPLVASMSFNLSDVSKSYETKNLNDTLVSEELGQIVLQTVNVSKEIKPANATGLYTYYKVKDTGSSFVYLTTFVTNNSNNDLMASSLATIKLVDSSGNEYPCMAIYENDEHSTLANASTTSLANGKTGIVHYAFEVNDEIASGEKTLIITIQGKVYSVKI